MSRRQKTANPLWEHFDKKDQNIAICKYCSVNISYKSTTGNLRCHLKAKHPHVLAQVSQPLEAPVQQFPQTQSAEPHDAVPQIFAASSGSSTSAVEVASTSSGCAQIPSTSLSGTVGPAPKQQRRQRTMNSYVVKPISSEIKKKIDRDLLNLFIEDMQPFNIVENKGFRKLLTWIPGYTPPSRKTISSSLIPALYEKSVNEFKKILESELETACITTDCWTSCNNESFIAVTAHYITSEFKFKSILLGCRGCPGSHTSIYLAQQIRQLLLEWNLLNKVNFAVSDNAPNICNALKENMRFKHFGCFAHTLNLIVRDALLPQQEMIEKVKKIVAHFKRSTQANEKLIKYQKNDLGVEQPKKLIMEVATRWNSTFYMIQRFVELSEAVRASMAVINRDWPIITEEEWHILRLLVKILAPFEEITSSLSGEKYGTGGLAIVLTNCIVDLCDEMLRNEEYTDTTAMFSVVLKLKDGIETRIPNVENSNSLGLCTLLDPRFKLATFKDDIRKTALKRYCQDLMETIICRQPTASVPPLTLSTVNVISNSSVWGKVDRLINSTRMPGTPVSKALREMKLYLEDEILPRQGPDGKWNDPTEWWQRHSKIYPTLAEIYRTKCNIVITSVPCERVFSKAGLILNERRTRLTTSKLEQLVFLNSNIALI